MGNGSVYFIILYKGKLVSWSNRLQIIRISNLYFSDLGSRWGFSRLEPDTTRSLLLGAECPFWISPS